MCLLEEENSKEGRRFRPHPRVLNGARFSVSIIVFTDLGSACYHHITLLEFMLFL